MNNFKRVVEKVLDSFQQQKGKGSVYCFGNSASGELAVAAYNKFRAKDKNSQVLIVVNNYNTRLDFINSNPVDTNYKILSEDYINSRYRYAYKFAIIIGINTLWEITKIKADCDFTLAIFKETLDNATYEAVTRELPMIATPDLASAARNDSISSPVEEHLIGVDVDSTIRESIDKYDKIIAKAITIFGDVATIEKARVGDKEKNISAAEIRDDIAYQNGWNPQVTDDTEYGAKINELYNPSNLEDLAFQFYDVTRARRELLTDYKGKLYAIAEIVKANLGKKILIVSKRAEFAAYITSAFNGSYAISCRDYHDYITPRTLVDEDGYTIVYKSGAKAGTPKVFGAAAISKFGLQEFNDSQTMNCLSMKEKADVKCKTTADIVIFTSAFCDSIVDFRKRFAGISFRNTPTITYRIYCNNTVESDKIAKLYDTPIIKYVNDTDNELTTLVENNGDVVL